MSLVRPPWFYTYLLWSERDKHFYTETTTNLRKRLGQHNKGLGFPAKNRQLFRLIYFEICLNKHDAYQREKYFKATTGKRYLRNYLKGGLTG